MDLSNKIKNARKQMGYSQKKLAEKTGLSIATIQGYEQNKYKPKIENLQKIAVALNITISDLVDDWSMFAASEYMEYLVDRKTRTVSHNKYFWTSYLDDKLAQIGCRIGWDEDQAMLWIDMPDGTLEITEKDLKEIDKSTTSYLQFKLEELKFKHQKDFRPRKPQ